MLVHLNWQSCKNSYAQNRPLNKSRVVHTDGCWEETQFPTDFKVVAYLGVTNPTAPNRNSASEIQKPMGASSI